MWHESHKLRADSNAYSYVITTDLYNHKRRVAVDVLVVVVVSMWNIINLILLIGVFLCRLILNATIPISDRL